MTQEELTKFKGLQLHESMCVARLVTVLKVPGGWLYTISPDNAYGSVTTTVLVPEPT